MRITLVPLMLVIALNGCSGKSSNTSEALKDQAFASPAAEAYVPRPATPDGYEEEKPVRTAAMAEYKTVPPSNNPKDKEYFSLVGKSFKVKKDNEWLFKKWPVGSTLGIVIFSKSPILNSCQKSPCDRREVYSDASIKIDDIIYPAKETEIGKYTCETSALFCYFKVHFDNGDVAYLSVGDFITASSPLHAVAFETPSLLQILPLEPDSKWRDDKQYYDIHFRKKGVQQGFTQPEVLNSNWGSPNEKSKSMAGDKTIEIWSYANGSMVGFINGYVERITTVQ